MTRRLRSLFVAACAPVSNGSGSQQRAHVAWTALQSLGDVHWLEGPPAAGTVTEPPSISPTHLPPSALLADAPAVWNPFMTPGRVRRVLKDCWVTTGRVPSCTPEEAASLRQAVRKRFGSAPFDVIWAFQVPSGAWVADVLSELLAPGGASIIDWDVAERPGVAEQARQQADRRGLLGGALHRLNDFKLAKVEDRLLRVATATVCASSVDQEYLRNRCPGALVETLPNSIVVPESVPNPPPAQRVLFVGLINYWPNREGLHLFVKNVWPAVRQRFPQARFDIVGLGVTPDIQAYHDRDGIAVIGAVDNVFDSYARCNVAVAPMLFSVGSSIKVLEGLAYDRPVVAFEVATRRHGLQDEEHIVAARSIDEFRERLIRVLESPDAGRAMAARGRQFVLERFERKAVTMKFGEFIKKSLGTSAASPECASR